MNDCTDECDLAELCSRRHWSIYWLIIFGSFLFVFGRILTVGGAPNYSDESPFMSANDRSRWATIRALGDENRFEIDNVIADKSSPVNWDSIDKVQHADRDGVVHYYSSKPTLFPTLVSYVYRAVKLCTGWTLKDDTTKVARVILILVNAVPWLIFLWFLGKTLERIQVRDWARYFVVTAAGFATFLSTFTITLNNHLPAAACVMGAIYCLTRIFNNNRTTWKYFAIAGMASAFSAANELPALSFFAIASVLCLVKSPAKFASAFAPTAAIVACGFFYTNYLAHNDWRPPYAHKGDGKLIASVEGDFESDLNNGTLPKPLFEKLSGFDLNAAIAKPANWPFDKRDVASRWKIQDLGVNKFTVVLPKDGDAYQIHEWDNWYDYQGSYWTGKTKSTVDRGQHDSTLYLFHVLFGHHGIYSLTPLWFLSIAGIAVLIFDKKFQLRWLGLTTVALTVTIIAFYVYCVPAHDRNYGGFTSAFRWAFWLAPFWLIGIAPIADWLGKTRTGRAICLSLLVISGVSAMYAADNPWCHPWLYEIWDATGLPK